MAVASWSPKLPLWATSCSQLAHNHSSSCCHPSLVLPFHQAWLLAPGTLPLPSPRSLPRSLIYAVYFQSRESKTPLGRLAVSPVLAVAGKLARGPIRGYLGDISVGFMEADSLLELFPSRPEEADLGGLQLLSSPLASLPWPPSGAPDARTPRDQSSLGQRPALRSSFPGCPGKLLQARNASNLLHRELAVHRGRGCAVPEPSKDAGEGCLPHARSFLRPGWHAAPLARPGAAKEEEAPEATPPPGLPSAPAPTRGRLSVHPWKGERRQVRSEVPRAATNCVPAGA